MEPTHTIPCDGVYVGDENGHREYPHRGQTATFCGRPTVQDQLLAIKLSRIGLAARDAPKEMTTRQLEELERVIEDLVGAVTRRLVSWDWVDDHGALLPITVETLMGLTLEELTQLVILRPPPDPKDSSPSTAPSAGTPSRRKRGT